MTPINVLVSLYPGYGLGDAVQMSAVLRHVVKARPHWIIDYCAEPGKETVGRGIAHNVFAYGKPYPSPHYDAEVQICLYDTWANFHDRPNTRVSSCLYERFGLDWDASCGGYQVNVQDVSMEAARTLLYDGVTTHRHTVIGREQRADKFVAVHYRGDSSPTKKNLSHSQADDVCQAIRRLGHEPVILDWRNQSPLPFRRITSPSAWGGDAEMVCAIISQCEAFVGIDSGPGKCASATQTPALVVWTRHHPAPFHDPAANTTHLVPVGYHGLEPVCNDPGVIAWFEANHNVQCYGRDPVSEIVQWLENTIQ